MKQRNVPLIFVSTHSRLLTKNGKDELERYLHLPVKILPLQQMTTEIQFEKEIDLLMTTRGKDVMATESDSKQSVVNGLIAEGEKFT